MPSAPEDLVGLRIRWTGVHHAEGGDFSELSTHTVIYETETTCHVMAGGQQVGEADYTYRKLDDRMGICIYRPKVYQGRSDVVLNAMFDFTDMKDRAVLLAGGAPFAVADGDMTIVPPENTPT